MFYFILLFKKLKIYFAKVQKLIKNYRNAQKNANLNDLLYLDNFRNSESRTENEQAKNKIVLNISDGVDLLRGNSSEIELYGAIINVQKQNKIVETELVNRVGKIKELIQESDYNVSISGNLVA